MTHFFRICIVLAFRLFCWCLVTSSFDAKNIFIGVIISSILPFGDFRKLQIRTLLPEIIKTLRLPFDMIKESFQLMMVRNPADFFVEEKVSRGTQLGSRFAEFMELFRITFTPMSLVVRRSDDLHWLVHQSLEKNSLPQDEVDQ